MSDFISETKNDDPESRNELFHNRDPFSPTDVDEWRKIAMWTLFFNLVFSLFIFACNTDFVTTWSDYYAAAGAFISAASLIVYLVCMITIPVGITVSTVWSMKNETKSKSVAPVLALASHATAGFIVLAATFWQS